MLKNLNERPGGVNFEHALQFTMGLKGLSDMSLNPNSLGNHPPNDPMRGHNSPQPRLPFPKELNQEYMQVKKRKLSLLSHTSSEKKRGESFFFMGMWIPYEDRNKRPEEMVEEGAKDFRRTGKGSPKATIEFFRFDIHSANANYEE